jgi:hypothetical protein
MSPGEQPRMTTKLCRYCNENFVPNRSDQIYCAEEHRYAWHSAEKAKALALYRTLQQAQAQPDQDERSAAA